MDYFSKKIYMKDTIYKSVITVIDISVYIHNCIMHDKGTQRG